jgi:hypothetical protein
VSENDIRRAVQQADPLRGLPFPEMPLTREQILSRREELRRRRKRRLMWTIALLAGLVAGGWAVSLIAQLIIALMMYAIPDQP